MSAALRVAITADPYIPVPPVHYGGIERVIDFLVRGLASRGHEVTLVAHPGSRTPAALVPYGSGRHFGRAERLAELAQVGGALWARRDRVDVVHSFGRLAALLPVLPMRRVGKVQSYQRESVPWGSCAVAAALAGDSLRFTGCGTHMWDRDENGDRARWRTVFNGVELARYPFRPAVPADAPLVFLGRLDRIKGAHHAIDVARASGRRLVLAGPRTEHGDEAAYFDRAIAPHVDGAAVSWIGPVDDARKAALLGGAAALLMLVEWDEPFGIVMAEALACGTPVIGFARGSVGEVVRDGVTGFTCRDANGAVAAVARLGSIDRAAARADCEARFSSESIVAQYESLYREVGHR
ncbi:MAG: glycosyltransferase [Gemmatimonadetes bacterium]|nr:glycosyltransferase [Gemmatimonadota bacterium]